MSRVEAVEQMAKAVLGNSDKVISTDEKAKTEKKLNSHSFSRTFNK